MKSAIKLDDVKHWKTTTVPTEPEKAMGTLVVLMLLASFLWTFIGVSYVIYVKTNDATVAKQLNESVLFAFRHGFDVFLALSVLVLANTLKSPVKKILAWLSQGLK